MGLLVLGSSFSSFPLSSLISPVPPFLLRRRRRRHGRAAPPPPPPPLPPSLRAFCPQQRQQRQLLGGSRYFFPKWRDEQGWGRASCPARTRAGDRLSRAPGPFDTPRGRRAGGGGGPGGGRVVQGGRQEKVDGVFSWCI